jgi:hypothetical protein
MEVRCERNLGDHIDTSYQRSSRVKLASTNTFHAQLSNCNIKIILFGIALGSCITLLCHKPYLVTACADLSSCLHPPVASAWISRTALPWSVESIGQWGALVLITACMMRHTTMLHRKRRRIDILPTGCVSSLASSQHAASLYRTILNHTHR